MQMHDVNDDLQSPNSGLQFIPWRFYFLLFFLLLLVLSLFLRLIDLSVFNEPFLRKKGDERALRLMSTPAFRGMILDRNGFPLAVSTLVYSVWVNPHSFHANPTFYDTPLFLQFAHLLNEKQSLIKRLIATHASQHFIYLKRNLSPEVAEKINHLGLPYIYLQKSYHRYYPEAESAAQLIGFTNVDDHGQEGIELAYDGWLRGKTGKEWVVKDRYGNVISHEGTVQTEENGKDITLSIDRRLQYLSYRALLAGVVANKADSAEAVILDAKTNEILAILSVPSFNPNHLQGIAKSYLRNRAITDSFEPGSVMKAFSVASALEQGVVNLNTKVDTSPGWMRVGHNLVRDEHNEGVLSLTEILEHSSNVGVTKIILSLPPNALWEMLHRVGFGEVTGSGFPGEQSGSLIKHDPWGQIVLATLAFGYGVSVTPVQLVNAYAIIANAGIKRPISLLKLEQPLPGERVLSAKVAGDMLTLMESVFTGKGGTAHRVRIPGYRLAGKTGTAWVVGAKGYDKHRYTSSIVGIAPVSDPRLVIVVVVHNPKTKKFLGGDVAGPIFGQIMQESLRILDVPPDNPIDPSNNGVKR